MKHSVCSRFWREHIATWLLRFSTWRLEVGFPRMLQRCIRRLAFGLIRDRVLRVEALRIVHEEETTAKSQFSPDSGAFR